MKELFQAKNEIQIIGIRHGEKMYETLLTNEECAHAVDMGNFYRVPADKRDLNYNKYFIQGNQDRRVLAEFNSNNTQLLNVDQVKEKLLSLRYIQNELATWEIPYESIYYRRDRFHREKPRSYALQIGSYGNVSV